MSLLFFSCRHSHPAFLLVEVILDIERHDRPIRADGMCEIDLHDLPVISQSNSMRMQARCCLIEDGDMRRRSCSIYAAT